MSFLAALGGINSVLGAIGGNKAGGKMAREGQDQMRQGLDMQKQAYQQMLNYYQNQLATGGFDTGQKMNLARQEGRRVLQNNMNNFVAQKTGMGYRTGDSVYQQGIGQINARADLDAQRYWNDIQNAARQEQFGMLGALSGSANQYGQAAYQNGQQTYQNGVAIQQANDPTAAIAGAIKMGMGNKDFWNWGRQFKDSKIVRSTNNPQAKEFLRGLEKGTIRFPF
jgi:hypothetical protein